MAAKLRSPTNGFWSALTIATTQRLPVLFFIEDNGYGISVKSDFQTPGGNIAANLAAFRNLQDPRRRTAPIRSAAAATHRAGGRGRSQRRGAGAAAPARAAAVRSFRPGHAGLQVADEIAAERSRDPLVRLREQLVPGDAVAKQAWRALETRAREDVAARTRQRRATSDARCRRTSRAHAFSEVERRRRRSSCSSRAAC